MARPSIKSYLVQAIWQWCTDVGDTPYLLVLVDDECVVPREYVENDQIVLDISEEATHNLRFEEDRIVFEARFGEQAMQCVVPYVNVAGLFPQEEPQKGMMFSPDMNEDVEDEAEEPEEKPVGAPVFSRVK